MTLPIIDHGLASVSPSTTAAGGAAAAATAPLPNNSSSRHRRSSPEDIVNYITVSDPVIHTDGMNKYTSYRVECRPPPPPSSNNTSHSTDSTTNNNSIIPPSIHPFSSVLRRYSDFLWLYDNLHKERPGSIVPPLPDKQAVARFSPEFVEDRRVSLEKFLRRVVIHPELGDSACLITFLRAEDLEFQHVKSMGTKTSTGDLGDYGMGGGGGDTSSLGGAGAFHLNPNKANTTATTLKKWFSEAKTTLSNDLIASPDDDLFDEIERYIEVLSIQMKRVSNQASSLVRKSREIANGLFEFSCAYHSLAQSEGGTLGSKLQYMGSAADSLSAIAVQQSERELHSLEEPFKDYLKIIHGVKLALSRRHEKRVSYTALLQEIQSREMNLHRLRMTPGCEAKAYSAEMSLQRYHAMANVAKEEYAECSQRVLREVDRFKREKAEEMRGVVLDFIMLEIEMNRAMERVWAELIPKLEEGESGVGEGGGAGGKEREDGGIVREGGTARNSGEGWGSGVQQQQQQQQQQIMTQTLVTDMPPPYYSNVPSASSRYNNAVPVEAAASSTTLMESSIQYRDNTLSGMGL